MTLWALQRSFAFLVLIGVGVGSYYLWAPLCHVYIGIIAFGILREVLWLADCVYQRGWDNVRIELAEANMELSEEILANDKLTVSRLKIRRDSNIFRKTGKKPEDGFWICHNIGHSGYCGTNSGPKAWEEGYPNPYFNEQRPERPRPKLRVIHGGLN